MGGKYHVLAPFTIRFTLCLIFIRVSPIEKLLFEIIQIGKLHELYDKFINLYIYTLVLVCTSLQILREHILSHDFPVGQGRRVPCKVWRDLFLKAFHGRWWAIYLGGCSAWGINYQIMLRGGVSQMHFSVIIFHFSNHEGIYT